MTRINEIIRLSDSVSLYDQRDLSKLFYQAGLLILAIISGAIFIFPLYWLVKIAIMWPPGALFGGTPSLVIENPSVYNFAEVLFATSFISDMINTAIFTALAIASQLLFCSFAAYALTLDIYGKKYIYAFIITAMLIPFQTIFLPDFLVTQRLGLITSYPGLAIVVAVSVVNILILRNAFDSIPQDLIDAARLDGASELYVLFGVYWPLSKPALSTIAILSFVFSWNNFLWPLVAVRDDSYTPLSLGLAQLSGRVAGDFALLYAYAIMALLPVLTAFLLLQNQFIRSVVSSSLKT